MPAQSGNTGQILSALGGLKLKEESIMSKIAIFLLIDFLSAVAVLLAMAVSFAIDKPRHAQRDGELRKTRRCPASAQGP
jgi:hypothetical protein